MITIVTMTAFANALQAYRAIRDYSTIRDREAHSLAVAWSALFEGEESVLIPLPESVAAADAALEDVTALAKRDAELGADIASIAKLFGLRAVAYENSFIRDMRRQAEDALAEALYAASYPTPASIGVDADSGIIGDTDLQ